MAKQVQKAVEVVRATINQATGKPYAQGYGPLVNKHTGERVVPLRRTKAPRYNLHEMAVGAQIIIEREGDFNPSYNSLRIHLIKRSNELGKKFVVDGIKFPQLVITRTK